MVIANNRQPAPARARDPLRSRWLPVTSLALVALGMLILLASQQPLPAATATAEQSAWHLATHSAGAGEVPGLALHPGPEVATLAAGLGPVGSPATILTIALSPVAAATGDTASSPATAETTPTS